MALLPRLSTPGKLTNMPVYLVFFCTKGAFDQAEGRVTGLRNDQIQIFQAHVENSLEAVKMWRDCHPVGGFIYLSNGLQADTRNNCSLWENMYRFRPGGASVEPVGPKVKMPEICPEAHRQGKINADAAMDAVRALSKGQ